MMKLDNFVGRMTGHFDNKDQFKKTQAEGSKKEGQSFGNTE